MKTTVLNHVKAMRRIISYLENHGRTVTETPQLRKKDKIDFYLDGISCKFKMCKYGQVNIIFEILNGRNSGWFKDSKAELFVYYIKETKMVYLIDIDATRKYCSENVLKMTSKGMSGNGLAYLIPIMVLQREGLIKEEVGVKR